MDTTITMTQELRDLTEGKEILWINEKTAPTWPVSEEEIEDARRRLKRFAPFIKKVFPETVPSDGIIESPLREIPRMLAAMRKHQDIEGRMLLKLDSHLQVAGSIKARGGIYEVLKHTEDLAIEAGLLKEGDSYASLAEPEMRDFFSKYTIQVGSTGNLGLSIGIASATIGYHVVVHMSADAKQWKKDLLREKGVEVKEYESDYSLAVEEGRRLSDADPMSYFVDDENSKDLFLGYAVAGRRLATQLEAHGVHPTPEVPIVLYLPCGVGGAPGGVAYGCKMIFKDACKIFFVEPTQAPCMALGMMTGLHEKIAVSDVGLDGKTIADGLAVGRPSGFVGKVMEPILDGIFTVSDDFLLPAMAALYDEEKIAIEPSACAAFAGPLRLDPEKLGWNVKSLIHIPWATGGALVPEEVMERELEEGRKMREERHLF